MAATSISRERLLEHAPAELEADAESGRRLTAGERLDLLFDEGSARVIRSAVSSARLGERARAGDGVIGASGTVDGRAVLAYAQDGEFLGGSLGEAHAETIVRVLQLARDARVPVVGFVESGGARLQEGVAALGGYGRIFRENVKLSGRVPQISVITGTSAGGGSYSPALTDFVVMTPDASMFLTGPGIVREVLGEEVSTEDLGGVRVHERNGVCQFAAQSDVESIFMTREILSYLPQNAWESPPQSAPAPARAEDPSSHVPLEARKVYDVRDVMRDFVDGGRALEVSPRWARNIVTAFARIDGRPIGVIANQARYLGGVLDADSAQKGARFVRTCNAYGVPLVVLVDVPGFLPGTRQESAGVIRHGAKLLHAFCEATVPRLTIVLRKAFGGGYITMNSKDLGADFAFAWPQAQIGVMGPKQAVGIMRRREIAAADDAEAARDQLAEDYSEEHLGAAVAAREGYIDEVIEPVETRARLADALAMLSRRGGRRGDAGNIQL